MDPRIKKIIDKWYLTEPVLLMTILSHEMVLNPKISCPYRCGRGKIEYNQGIIDKLTENQLENALKAEAIRIILKHPYERQPDGCRRKSMALGSNLVLADNYDFSDINMPKPSDYGLPENESYEWYSLRIEEKCLIADDSECVENNVEIDSYGLEKSEGQICENSLDGDSDASNNEGELVDLQKGSQSSMNSKNDESDDFYVLTLANGTKVYISKGDAPNQKNESEDDGSNEPNDTKENNQTEQSKEDKHLEENRKFECDPPKVENISKELTSVSEDLSSLWEEDSLMCCTIDAIIEDIESSGASWGSLAGTLANAIIANTKAKVDYRKVLTGFRASVLSSKRSLTRMRPNRRSGFENMGSIRRFNTNLLIAVDVSGSVSDMVLSHFYSIIGKIFKYGIEHIDVVQFDCAIGEVQTFEKAKKRVDIVGRGGTSFQPLFDYVYKKNIYDGLIIFTDGDAPKPQKPKGFKTKVVWICESENKYEEHKSWMKETGRCCFIKL